MLTTSSSIYYCEPIKRQYVFDLGLSMALQIKRVHETTCYFILTHALGVSDVPMKKALVELGRRLVQRCPVTYLVGHALNGVAIQTFVSLLRYRRIAPDSLAVLATVEKAGRGLYSRC
jgi:hypothetical protein